ncbi:MAG TPA: methyltransferase domain-containing protein [Bacteroidales bacterium]|nr:methyltransferase domain-containing protein [Bacteroidales bacterium]
MSIKTAERNSGVLPEDNVIHHRHLIAYQEAAKLCHGRVLEIGSGEGYGIKILAQGAIEYHAVDKHATPVPPEEKNVVFRQMNVPPLDGFEDNYFDIVVTFQVIEHIKNDSFFVSEIYRILKPGGKLILTTPNIAMSLTRNPWHIREYTLKQMQGLLEKKFADFEIKGVYGNKKVMAYYEENRRSVKKITRFDILKLQYILPRRLLQIPYDIANRINRNKLMKNNNTLVAKVVTEDFFIEKANETCFDFFVIACK